MQGAVRRVIVRHAGTEEGADEMKCPSCKSPNVRLSARFQLTDLAERLRGQSAYRCRNCRQRFYGHRDPGEKFQAKLSQLWTSARYRERLLDRCRSWGGQLALFGLGLAIFFGMLKLVAG